PIAPRTYGIILDAPAAYLVLALGQDHPQMRELQSILSACKVPEDKAAIQRRLADLYAASAGFRHALDEVLIKLGGTAGDAHSFDALDELISAQSYRLAYWRVAAEEINYRRFFDINTMAAIRVELPEVFNATHELIYTLLLSGQVTGLRID